MVPIPIQEVVARLEHPSGSHRGQGDIYIALPAGHSGEGLPVLLALHGNGRDAYAYRDTPFYRTQRDLALRCGFLFAAVSNGPDTWGADAGLENVLALLKHLQCRYRTQKSFGAWASSAGGLMLQRLLAAQPERLALLLATFPVFDPLMLPSLDKAANLARYGHTDQWSQEETLCRFGGRSTYSYSGKRLAIAHGRDDTVVPTEHALAFQKHAVAHGGTATLFIGHGGHSTDNFDLYNTGIFEFELQLLAKQLNSTGYFR